MALRTLGGALSRLSLTALTARNAHQPSHSWLHHKPFHSITSLSLQPQYPAATIPATALSCCLRHCSAALTSPVSRNTCQPVTLLSQVRGLSTSEGRLASLYQMHRSGPIKKKRKNKNPLINRPFARGVVLKTLIKKPKKPNSANRKCVLVRLTTGREMIAYVPGEGHNLQEHNVVLVRPGRLRDVPGVKLKCVRGKYDLQHVIKKKN